MISPEYVAGFLDADGYVALATNGRPVVTLTNADRNIFEVIQIQYGGKISLKRVHNENHNSSYELSWGDRQAYNLLVILLPYMLHQKKKLRTQLIIDKYLLCTPRNGKYTPEQRFMKEELYKQVMSIIMRGKGAYNSVNC